MEPGQAAAVLGWGEIIKIVLASGVVAAVVGVLKEIFFKSRDRQADAKYAAIRVVAKLDLYVLQSRSNVSNYYECSGGLDPHEHYQNWPDCPYPELDISTDELKLFSTEHASALAWIATEKAIARQHLIAINEAAWDPTEVYGHQADVVGYFGYEAYLLAGKLRRRHGLPSFGERWGVHDDFSDLLRAWNDTKKEVAKRREPAAAT